MILTEEEVMILEDMKEIEAIQEEIESYLIEKYGLENLEEGNFFQWLASPFTRRSKHYVTRKGDVKFTYEDSRLMKKNARGEPLTPAEKKRVTRLKGIAGTIKDAVDEEKDARITLRDAKRREKGMKKEAENERKAVSALKKHDLASHEEHELYKLVYGDGMSKKAAKKLIKKKRKDYADR